MTQVEALAKYAARASFADLSAESRRQLPIHILDSLACCIAALGAGPVEACHTQVEEFGGTSPCTLIGGGHANPIYAAFWHTALVPTSILWTISWLKPKLAIPRIISALRSPSPTMWTAVAAI